MELAVCILGVCRSVYQGGQTHPVCFVGMECVHTCVKYITSAVVIYNIHSRVETIGSAASGLA